MKEERTFFFRRSSELGQNADGRIQKETAAASGQGERVSLKATALPGLARDSPVASLIKFSTVSTTGTAEKEGFPRIPQLALPNRRDSMGPELAV